MRLRDAPVQRKLIMMMLLTSSIVLLVTCTTFLVYEFVKFRQDLLLQKATLGEVIAANSTAALAFQNQSDAQEILAALSVDRHVSAAGLYDQEGHLFARFPATLTADSFPAAPGIDGFRFGQGYLVGYQPVAENSKRWGTLYLKSDMQPMYERFRLYSLLAAVVLIGCMVLAYLMSKGLQKQLSEPILALAATATIVSKQRDYSVRVTPLGKDELGTLTEAFNHMLDEIQQQDLVLRQSEERFRLMVENVQDYAIIMLDQEGRIVTWNDGAEHIYGYNAVEILGQSFETFDESSGDGDRGGLRHLAHAARSGSAQYESWRVRKDGSLFRAHIVLTALRDEQGALRGFSKVTHDITERQRAEEEIRRLNAELEMKVIERTSQLELAVKELEAFGYSISHDLRAPLRTIDGFSQAIMEDFEKTPPNEAKRHLQVIRDEAVRMGQLIDDLLRFSRLSREPMAKLNVDTGGLVRSVLADFTNQKLPRKVQFNIGELPVCCGDPSLLRQVWQNLISNAIKYTQQRETALIDISSAELSGRRVYYVQDNGTGFDMKYYHKLFGVFQRLHRSEDYPGTGVGLAIVKRIIERHGGRVWAEATPNKGATFFFSLEGEPNHDK